MNTVKLNTLDARCKELAILISRSETTGNNNIFSLKKELYETKIKMIEIITVEEKRAGITAGELRRLVSLRPKVPRYETGVQALDYNLRGGIELGTFVQLAGESGTGKTHLVLEVLSNVANYSKTVFFNFEMGDIRIINRLEKLLTRDEQWNNLIIDKDSRDIDTLYNEITLHARDGVKFFTIDSKMKIEVTGNQEDHQKFSNISSRLAKLSQQNDIIIFLINQMSEQDIKNKRLAFKGSGDQQYDSDISLFYVKDENGQRTLICSKNRQDEITFRIDTFLDADNKTISNGSYPVSYQNAQGRTIAKPTVTEYKEKFEMSVL